jgi:hypothetical protein
MDLEDTIAFAGLLVPDSGTVDPGVRHCAFFGVVIDRSDLDCIVKTSEVKPWFAKLSLSYGRLSVVLHFPYAFQRL